MVVLLMGVAGSGKTTIGALLSARLRWPFHDADDLHLAANRAKMRRGIALTDDDRRPWLRAVHELIASYISEGVDAIVACSALKHSYRDVIVVDPAVVKVVYLKGSYELIASRLAHRYGHFFNLALLRSQFDALEEPSNAMVEEVSSGTSAIVDLIVARLNT